MSLFSRFRRRSTDAELIDELTLTGDALRQNLRELAFINKWLGGNQLTISGLNRLKDEVPAGTPLRIADLGCGGGDMLALMARWAEREKVNASFVGVDANAFILSYARERTAKLPQITYIQENVFSEDFAHYRFDIVTCTLFCHHFTNDQLIELFSRLRRQTSYGIVINDLHRHGLAYYSIAWLTKWFSKSYLVKNDAKLSVWRSFRRTELEDILRAAGFTRFSIRWRWAFRWEVVVFGEGTAEPFQNNKAAADSSSPLTLS